MRLATWNVNSIVARQERLLAWLGRQAPEIVCLQELKVTDDKFPGIELAAAGYQAAVFGQKGYNGVAILARQGIEISDVRRGLDAGLENGDARLISARIVTSASDAPLTFRLLCAYVPNGQVVGSDKWAYKLAWLERLRTYVAEQHRADEPLLLCGDFNVAPDDLDVAKPAGWVGSVLTHDDVRRRYAELTAWGLRDLFREKVPAGGVFTWWDYRQLGFPKNDGLRIDLVLATAALAARCTAASVDRQERKGQKPSDHAPVIVELS